MIATMHYTQYSGRAPYHGGAGPRVLRGLRIQAQGAHHIRTADLTAASPVGYVLLILPPGCIQRNHETCIK